MVSEFGSTTIPQAAVRGVAGGLILMAFFTLMWGGWATTGVSTAIAVIISVFFAALAIAFVVHGIGLFRAVKRFTKIDTPERKSQSKSMGQRFGIIFATEGVLIGAASAVLGATDNYTYINPVIALIVGAHFLPLARVFDRTIDYYIGAWVMAAGLVGIGLLLYSSLAPFTVWTIVSLAVACGTSLYGFYMIEEKRSMLRRQDTTAATRGTA